MRKVFLGLLLMLASVAAVQAADKPDTPTTLNGGKVISVAEAKTMLDKKEAQFFDTRKALNFGKGHIPGAISVSYQEKSEPKADFDATQDSFDLSKLPADKNAKLVFYSDGPAGWKSYKAAVLSIKGGYKNVFWLRSGYAEWSQKGMPSN